MTHLKETKQTILGILMVLVILLGIKWNQGVVTAATLGKATLSIVSRTTTSVELKYSKIEKATGYQIYRATKQDGLYKKIKTTKSLTYKDTGVTSGKSYYYKVRAYKNTSGKNYYGSFSNIKGVKLALGKTSGLVAYGTEEGIKLNWNQVSNAKSYRIYRASSKSGSYKYITSLTSLSYLDKNISNEKTYYYKVRAYSIINTTKYYGASKTVSAKKISNTGSKSYQQKVIDLVNKERRAQGLSELTTTGKLENAAYKRAKEIVTVFDHTRPDGSSCFTVLGEYGISYLACGENIAYGQRTPEEVVDAWMHSEGHRRNIMSSNFGKIGIGYYVENGIAYWVQLFTNA